MGLHRVREVPTGSASVGGRRHRWCRLAGRRPANTGVHEMLAAAGAGSAVRRWCSRQRRRATVAVGHRERSHDGGQPRVGVGIVDGTGDRLHGVGSKGDVG